MQFTITIQYDRRNIRLAVERTHFDNFKERFRVHARNGDIVVESNRPLFRKRGLRHRQPDWKQVEGPQLHRSVLEDICNAIQFHVDR